MTILQMNIGVNNNTEMNISLEKIFIVIGDLFRRR